MSHDKRMNEWIESDRSIEEEFGTTEKFYEFRELWREELKKETSK
jgi:hypothetical protein